MLYIGIDLGTSAVKLLLVDGDGRIHKTVSKEYPLYFPHPGWAEQNPEDWYARTLEGLKELLQEADKAQVAGISFGGQMHGLVVLDGEDKVIRPAILWNDGRTAEQTDYLNQVVGKEKLSEYTANIAFAGFTAPKLLWMKEQEPENFAKIEKIMLPKDYLAYRLSGVHCTDYSDASGMLLLDVKNRRWSKPMLEICGVTEKQLPKLYESYEVVGTLKKELAEETGLSEAVKIIAGAGDNAAAAVGTGTVGDGRCNISLGTSGTIFISSKSFGVDAGNALHSFDHADGYYHLMGCMLSAASCNKWWNEEILQTKDFAAEQAGIRKPGENPVFFLPYLMGERSPHNDPKARGTFIGMTMDTTRADMTQAVLEGVAFGLRDSLEVAKSQGIQIERTKICGGGAKSPLWKKIIANVMNLKVDVIETEEGPGYGGAILAAVGCGEFSCVEEAAEKLVKIVDTVEPEAELVAKYEERYQKFRKIYPSVKKLFQELEVGEGEKEFYPSPRQEVFMGYGKNIRKILYGGDYNPEQWPEDVWLEDMRMFKKAHINEVTLNVFSWAALQPDENTYDFTRLDKIMGFVRENGLKVCMATSTGAHPAWMAKRHPDILRTEAGGMKRKFGGRHNSCPNSPTYRYYAPKLAGELAKRYKDYDNIVAWHVSNEFGGECYCENCEKAFREWLKRRYGTIEEVNKSFNASFWGHTFYDWDEIVLPNLLSEHFEHNGREMTMFQGISLDYRRFMSDSMLDCFRLEYDAIKKEMPDIPVTTNLMGFFKLLDYQKWARYMDFVSWDSYPRPQDSPAAVALNHDLMRGVGGQKSFVLMEQTPSVTNWHPYNKLKRPGEMRLLSYQAMAHGADAIQFFQLRRSIGACEKYHGAVIDHAGRDDTRVFREVEKLGEELACLGDVFLEGKTPAETAIVFDWDNWWAVEYSAGPSVRLQYLDAVRDYYTALHKQNIPVDIISTEDDMNGYKVVFAPLLYMTKTGYDEKIRRFVSEGGTFVTTYFSGIVNEHDLVIPGGYPGELKDILGIWVEEQDALPEEEGNAFLYRGEEYPADMLCDIMHLESAEAISSYEKDFYAGTPVLTVNSYGKGKAWYVGTRSSASFYDAFAADIVKDAGVSGVMQTPDGVEAALRRTDSAEVLFLLNHNNTAAEVTAETEGENLLDRTKVQKGDKLVLAPKGVAVVQRKR